MINVLKGALLGLANGIAFPIALGPLLVGDHHIGDTLSVIGILAIMMSVPCGAVLGWLAGRLRNNRIIVLEVIALALIPICGVVTVALLRPGHVNDYELLELATIAAGPVMLGVLALERWTRPRFETARALGLGSPTI